MYCTQVVYWVTTVWFQVVVFESSYTDYIDYRRVVKYWVLLAVVKE
jgi:hypothetical protein